MKKYKVEFFSPLFDKQIVKSFDCIEAAIKFATKTGGILII